MLVKSSYQHPKNMFNSGKTEFLDKNQEIIQKMQSRINTTKNYDILKTQQSLSKVLNKSSQPSVLNSDRDKALYQIISTLKPKNEIKSDFPDLSVKKNEIENKSQETNDIRQENIAEKPAEKVTQENEKVCQNRQNSQKDLFQTQNENQRQKRNSMPVSTNKFLNDQQFRLLVSIQNTKRFKTIIKLDERFSLGRLLGKGRFGDVFQAIDKYTGQLIALKVISKSLIESHQIGSYLMEEIKIQSFLNHPNILKLYGVMHDSKRVIQCIFMILENCDSDLLNYFRKATNPMFEDRLRQITEALAYMHQNGIIHRDLKLENILTCSNEVKLADFGLAKYIPEFQDASKDYKLYPIVGTPGYMAPEIQKQCGYDLKVDAFSLGILIYESLIGEISGKDIDITKIDKNQIKIDPLLKNLVLKLLEPDPTKRLSVQSALKHPWYFSSLQLKTKIQKENFELQRMIQAQIQS